MKENFNILTKSTALIMTVEDNGSRSTINKFF